MSHHPLSRLRLQLLANGYSVLPGLDKTCRVKRWNSDFIEREIKRFGSYPAAILGWDTTRPQHRTTNVRIENGLVAIDCDVDDPVLAADLACIMAETMPAVFDNAPARFGSGTRKITYFARLASGEEPFVRHGTRKYAWPEDLAAWRSELNAARTDDRSPSASRKPAYHHVEVFAGAPTKAGHCSRQFGVYGPHTVAGAGVEGVEYSWAEGPKLSDTPLGELPTVTAGQVWEILARFEAAALAVGCEAMEEEGGGSGGWVYDIDRDSTRFETVLYGQVSYSELEDLVAADGEVRCILPGMVTTRPDRCSATWSDKYACAMVTDWKTDSWHVPADLNVSWDDLKAQAEFFERLRASLAQVQGRRVEVTDFYAYLVEHKYIHIPTRAMWPVASINAVLGKIGGLKASTWLDQNRRVNQLTWAPGEAEVIVGRVMVEGGWRSDPSTRVFNLYMPPPAAFAAGDITVWRDHLMRIYPGEADEIEVWMAHRAQRPAEKLNQALVLGGKQGIGKDTLLEPLRHAVGSWNFNEVNPIQLMGRFNEYLKAVVLRISEVRDRGETDRYAFYNHTKIMIAAPPDTLLIDGKNMKEYRIPNVVGLVMTLNEKSSLYLPADDRRHFVAWSKASMEQFEDGYFERIYRWYAAGGLDAVANHLMTLDLSGFDAKRPPRKTEAFLDIMAASVSPEDEDMAEVLNALGWPAVVTVEEVKNKASGLNPWFFQYLTAVTNNRKVPHRFEGCGYVRVRNPDNEQGVWYAKDKRKLTIYGRVSLTPAERLVLAQRKVEGVVVDLKPRSPD